MDIFCNNVNVISLLDNSAFFMFRHYEIVTYSDIGIDVLSIFILFSILVELYI